jgi:hypothetical protein
MQEVKLELLDIVGVSWRPRRLYEWFCARALRDRRVAHVVRRNTYDLKFVRLPSSAGFPSDFTILTEADEMLV